MSRPGRGLERVGLSGVVGLVLLAVSGCASISPPPAASVAGGVGPNTRELVQNLIQRSGQLRSLRTLATVRYWGSDGRAGFQEAVLVHRPDRLRLETLSPMGAILIVTADADEIAGFHPREGLFYRGRSSKENLFRYTHIPLTLAELTSLLVGLPPVEVPGHWQEDNNSIYWEIDGGGRERIVFDPALGVAVEWQRSGADGEIELAARFSNFSATPNGLFPLTIFLDAPPQQKQLEIRYQEPELNVAFPSDLFVQQKPSNAKELPIESAGG